MYLQNSFCSLRKNWWDVAVCVHKFHAKLFYYCYCKWVWKMGQIWIQQCLQFSIRRMSLILFLANSANKPPPRRIEVLQKKRPSNWKVRSSTPHLIYSSRQIQIICFMYVIMIICCSTIFVLCGKPPLSFHFSEH